jgi:hypothetical protein
MQKLTSLKICAIFFANTNLIYYIIIFSALSANSAVNYYHSSMLTAYQQLWERLSNSL